MKRPFILACLLAAFAFVVGACDGTGGMTVAGGSLFPTAPGASSAPGSALAAGSAAGTFNGQQDIAAVISAVVIHPTQPVYPYGAP